jgi:hypothetical protein
MLIVFPVFMEEGKKGRPSPIKNGFSFEWDKQPIIKFYRKKDVLSIYLLIRLIPRRSCFVGLIAVFRRNSKKSLMFLNADTCFFQIPPHDGELIHGLGCLHADTTHLNQSFYAMLLRYWCAMLFYRYKQLDVHGSGTAWENNRKPFGVRDRGCRMLEWWGGKLVSTTVSDVVWRSR